MKSADFFSGSLSGTPYILETPKIDFATYDKRQKKIKTSGQHHDMSKTCLQLSQLSLYMHLLRDFCGLIH